MKVRVFQVEAGGAWGWEIVAGNGAVVGMCETLGPKRRVVEQAQRVAGPLGLVVAGA